jgi:hypothetical protein
MSAMIEDGLIKAPARFRCGHDGRVVEVPYADERSNWVRRQEPGDDESDCDDAE